MKSVTLTLIAVLMLTVSITAQDKKGGTFKDSDKPLLSAGKKIYVERADKDAHVAMSGELQKWDRWKLVGDATEADIVVKLEVSGNSFWGVGHVQAFILEKDSRRTLYVSKRQKGTRTIFHGYASPFSRAISGIVGQMKKDMDRL